MNYAAPLKVKLRLIVFEVDQETQAKSVKDIKEQDVYMGDMPLMTEHGTFIINGTERVIVSQMHRSPGVFFDHDKGKTHSSGKLLFAARVIPYRGSWLDFEFDAKDIIYVRIDRRRKLPVTTLFLCTWSFRRTGARAFYKRVTYKHVKDGWTTPFDAERMKNLKPANDLKNAKTGDVVIEAGRKLTPRAARKLAEDGLKAIVRAAGGALWALSGDGHGQRRNGEIYAEAGDELNEKSLKDLVDSGFDEIISLDIDHVTTGGFIRNTLAVDKNQAREQALIDIYRVMRPGEPPTLDTAETLFNGLFFDSERYDLSAVGRVKDELAPRPQRARHDAHSASRGFARGRARAARPARRQRRDRRYRQSRQSARAFGGRVDGESISHRLAAHGACDQRAHEFGRNRQRHAARLDQREAGGGGGTRILRLFAAVAVHGPNEPTERDHA